MRVFSPDPNNAQWSQARLKIKWIKSGRISGQAAWSIPWQWMNSWHTWYLSGLWKRRNWRQKNLKKWPARRWLTFSSGSPPHPLYKAIFFLHDKKIYATILNVISRRFYELFLKYRVLMWRKSNNNSFTERNVGYGKEVRMKALHFHPGSFEI